MWREYYELEAPEEAELPCGYDRCLNEFEKMAVMRCLRMDRITVGYGTRTHAHMHRATTHRSTHSGPGSQTWCPSLHEPA